MCLQIQITSIQITTNTANNKIVVVTCDAIILPNGRKIEGHMSIDDRGYVTIFEDNSGKIYVLNCTEITPNMVIQTIDVIETVQKQN